METESRKAVEGTGCGCFSDAGGYDACDASSVPLYFTGRVSSESSGYRSGGIHRAGRRRNDALLCGCRYGIFSRFSAEAADLIFRLLCAIEEMLLSLLIFLNGLPEGTVFDYRYAASPPACVFLIYYAALFFFFSEAGRDFMRDRKRRMKRMLCVFLIFVSAGCCAGMYADRAARAGDLIFLDVGQGDCAHLRGGGTISL